MTFKVEVSYMEIYNEKVRDLLGDGRAHKRSGLKVREHKIFGELSNHIVPTFQNPP
jgi:hypothetical protein